MIEMSLCCCCAQELLANRNQRDDDDELDIDHMSYEELQRLEERMGNVGSSGASTNSIENLPTHKFVKVTFFFSFDLSMCARFSDLQKCFAGESEFLC
jgi:hypothetical protein